MRNSRNEKKFEFAFAYLTPRTLYMRVTGTKRDNQDIACNTLVSCCWSHNSPSDSAGWWIKTSRLGTFIGICTVYALLANDFRLAFTCGSGYDILFDLSIFLVIGIFAVDIFANIIKKPDYPFSFDFLADSISTLLLLSDVSIVSNSFIYSPSVNGSYNISPIVSFVITSGKQLRLIRVVRTLERSSFFKFVQRRFSGISYDDRDRKKHDSEFEHEDEELQGILDSEKTSPQLARLLSLNTSPRSSSSRRRISAVSSSSSRRASRQQNTLETTSQPNESKVGRKLTESNTRRVGILIILCASVAPLVSMHKSPSSIMIVSLQNFTPLSSPLFELEMASVINNLVYDPSITTRIAWLGYRGNSLPHKQLDQQYYPAITFEAYEIARNWDLHCEELPREDYVLVSLLPELLHTCPGTQYRRMIEVSYWFQDDFMLILDERKNIEWQAIFGLIQIGVTIVLMLVLSVLFNSDCERILLIPMNRLVYIMRAIQADPLCANTLIDKEMNTEIEYRAAKTEYESRGWTRRIWPRRRPMILSKEAYREFATRDNTMLEQTILKFGSLLVVGFGEAGASIVSAIVRNPNQSWSGVETEAIFGYVSICDFDTVTDVLQDGIVVLVNQLAEIIHGLVDEYGGFTSRNTGSGFSLIWRLHAKTDENADAITRRMCDLALLAMMDIQVAIRKAPALAIYSSHPHLMMRLPGYKVRVRAALHVGRAIEGPVGSSDFKIEAAYLGSDVVWTEKLTKLANTIYSTSLILSSAFVDSLSSTLKTNCRQIDVVSLEQNGQRLTEIYTLDIDLSALQTCRFRLDEEFIHVRNPQLRAYLLRDARKRRREYKTNIQLGYDPGQDVQKGDSVIARRKYMSSNAKLFEQIFKKSLLNYACKEWEIARRSLRQCIMFWVTHSSDGGMRKSNSTDAINSQHIRSSTLTRIQTSSDQQLINLHLDLDLVDGPSFAMLKFIITHSGEQPHAYRKI